MFENLVEILKKNPRKIVYTEGTDARILESAARLKADGFLTPVLVGNVDEVKAAAAKGGFDIEGLEIIDPENYEGFDEMVETMVALRKGKMSAEDCAAALKKSNYFGTMLVKMGKADALLGGATYSTADTVRPALQLVKTKPGSHLVSSVFIMVRGEEMLAMGDCAINIDYTDTVDKDGNVTFSAADKLAETGVAISSISLQRLKNSAVLTVHRKNPYPFFPGKGDNQMSCCHQGLFIGKGNIFPRLDGRNGGADSYHADNCRDHNFRLRNTSSLNQAVHSCNNPDCYVF